MDITEDLSARVLVKHILNVEPPRTPLTRSTAGKIGSGTRRSSRLNRNDPVAQTPQMMLRRSLKHKIRESISSKPFPSKRRTASAVVKHTHGQTSVLFDDGDTPRQILKNILLTEPVKSPVVNEQMESQQPQPTLDFSLQSRRPSIEVSGLDLPDLTFGNIETPQRRLHRKRPHRSLSITAFEKHLREANEVEESVDDPSSLSLSSSTSLSLKTPFNDVRTERKALHRKGANRRKVSEEDFGAAVDQREMGIYQGMSSVAPGQELGETIYPDSFTLGQSKLSEPEISLDIVHSNTALYAKTDAAMSNVSTIATQDKPTVMASQIQRDIVEQQNDDQMPYSFPMEKNTLIEDQDRSQSLLNDPDISKGVDKNHAASFQSEKEKSVANRTFDTNEPREVENAEQVNVEEADSQTEEDAGAVTSSESQNETDIQTENEGDGDKYAKFKNKEPAGEQQCKTKVPSSLSLEEEETDSQTNDKEEEGEEDEEVEEDDAEEEEEDDMVAAEERVEEDPEETEDDDADKEEEMEADVAVEDSVEEDQEETEDDDAKEEEEMEADVAVEDSVEEEEETQDEAEGAEDDAELTEGNEAEDIESDTKKDENEQNLDNSEHITQRAQCPEGELIMPILSTEDDFPDRTVPGYSDHVSASPAHNDYAEGITDNSNKENSFPENDPPDDVEEMEQSVEESEEEEEDQEEIPLKTPAFVKEKRNFFNLDPQASPFAPKKNSDEGPSAPGVKSKQKAQRKPRSQKSDPGLPKSYLMNVFKHYAKTKVSADVYPILKDVMDKFFERVAKDLEAYALHARRSTIEVADCELLLRRQGHVNDKVPVEVLIEKYLRMDQRKLLIPIATSGNVVIPKR